MAAEVHYGGQNLDELDQRLFRVYCDARFNPTLLRGSYPGGEARRRDGNRGFFRPAIQPTGAESGSGSTTTTASKPKTQQDLIQLQILELLAALPAGEEEALGEESLPQTLRSKVLSGSLELHSIC
ncbi:hypothetical protein PR003_g14054 [Phytophthora rubi]|uniref:Uncharacterized protein n=1 Tax=Phytophthora rubi TaxID=129364 RepID=A0A6A3LJN5_9STRA|nr:hypothetical protein PR002_g13149 [Phytophthora rubi]KAE9023582.1 hypothetical protein PR001_g12870 [Phytophthora rubi]KAE9333372.1 hypothetical protein PR003_g14054 [Phytophthora rubi]